MSTFLFVTNPHEYTPGAIEAGQWNEWSCGKSVKAGDRAFVYLTKGEGIKYEWAITSDAEPEPKSGYGCGVEPLKFFEPSIPRTELLDNFAKKEWAAPYTQFRGMKCIRLQDEVAERIRALRPNSLSKTAPGKIEMRQRKNAEMEFLEGEKRAQTSVTRDAGLRAAAKERWGLTCACCGFQFEEVYGPAAKGLGIVHHLEQFTGKVRKATVEDVRVVCANCHLVIHAKKKPQTIDQMKAMVGKTWTFWSNAGVQRKD